MSAKFTPAYADRWGSREFSLSFSDNAAFILPKAKVSVWFDPPLLPVFCLVCVFCYSLPIWSILRSPLPLWGFWGLGLTPAVKTKSLFVIEANCCCLFQSSCLCCFPLDLYGSASQGYVEGFSLGRWLLYFYTSPKTVDLQMSGLVRSLRVFGLRVEAAEDLQWSLPDKHQAPYMWWADLHAAGALFFTPPPEPGGFRHQGCYSRSGPRRWAADLFFFAQTLVTNRLVERVLSFPL